MSSNKPPLEAWNPRKRYRSLCKWGMGLMGFLLVGGVITTTTRLVETVSPSLEGIRYILMLKSSSFKRGDIVLIRGHTVPYAGDKPLAKRILGLPGDVIAREKSALKVGDTLLPLLKATRKRNPLTPLSVTSVPEGTVFVAGDNPNSFDSRYEEFGLVKMEKIWGRGVFTW